jgi:hypothetical protein
MTQLNYYIIVTSRPSVCIFSLVQILRNVKFVKNNRSISHRRHVCIADFQSGLCLFCFFEQNFTLFTSEGVLIIKYKDKPKFRVAVKLLFLILQNKLNPYKE